MTSLGALCLGKQEATPKATDITLRSIVDVERANATPPKPYHPHDRGFPILMYGNGPDESVAPGFRGAGDCVWAMFCNFIQLWRHASGKPLAPLDGKSAIRAYSQFTGYQIGVDSTDQGTNMATAASQMRHTGLLDNSGKRHKIGAYVTFNPTSIAEQNAAIKVFGAVGLGIQFPSYAAEEFREGLSWEYRAGGQIEGGHAITIPRKQKVYSWAREFGIGDAFIVHYSDEAFAFISPEFLDTSHHTPEGFDQAALLTQLAALT